MSVQTQIDRISRAVSAALAALSEKGVEVPAGTKVDGLAALIAAIEAGGGSGGGIALPSNCVFSSGSYVPASEGTDVLHTLTIAEKFIGQKYGIYIGVHLFALYRKDGFTATGGSDNRYLVSYVGLCGDGNGCGAAVYRTGKDLVGTGGADSSSSPNYGIPKTATSSRKNCYIRNVSSYEPTLTFSTYGLNTLEAGCEYEWFAVLNGSVYEV